MRNVSIYCWRMISCLKLTNAHTVRGMLTLKNDWAFPEWVGPRTQGKSNEIQWHQILIDEMTNRNTRSVRVKLIEVWREECVSSLRVERFVWLVISVTTVIWIFTMRKTRSCLCSWMCSDEGRDDCQQLKPKGNKWAVVKMFQRPQIALALTASCNFFSLWKFYSCSFIPNCTWYHVITCSYNQRSRNNFLVLDNIFVLASFPGLRVIFEILITKVNLKATQ